MAAVSGSAPKAGTFGSSRSKNSKPSPRPYEVRGITSQEAVEFAISYAKQQKALQEQDVNQDRLRGRTDGPRQVVCKTGPEEERHYHTITKSQPRQLKNGARSALRH